ncbi:hypothetical protein H7F15_06845 [Pontibacter sp. Tf4]|nr:hypothetical protein [Pontibacter sp. Tf4]
MRKIFFAALLVFVSATAFAQGPKNPAQSAPASLEQRATAITNGMVKHLQLNPEQARRLAEVNLNSMKMAEEAKKKYKKDPKKVVAQLDAISETRLSLIKDILTPQQFAQYQQRREEKMGVPNEIKSNPASRQEGSRYNEQYNN